MKKDWWNQEFRALITLGESTTAGGGSSYRERCWTNQLARQINEVQRHPIQFVNMGIGANVISTKSPCYEHSGKPAANERLDRHVLKNPVLGSSIEPDLLVISYGLNDARGGTPIDLFCSEMRDILRRIQEKIRPLIVLLGPYYMTDFFVGEKEWWIHANLEVFYQYNNAIRQVAEQDECLFVDLLESYRNADWLVHYDGCHANDVGHRIVANKVFEVLASNCSGLSLETKALEREILPWRDESTLQQ